MRNVKLSQQKSLQPNSLTFLISKISATRDETTKIVNETFIFKDIDSKTPSNAE